MANLKDLAQVLQKMHFKNNNEDLQKKIEICFKILEQYSCIHEKELTVGDEKYCCYAALILSGIIQRGLAKKVIDFFRNHRLPVRAVQLLRANLMRMEAY